MDEKVRVALKRVPQLKGFAPGSVTCARLGGLTNRVYRLEAGDARYVLRIPGAGTDDYIDRKVEGHNARVAASAGVSQRAADRVSARRRVTPASLYQ